jgi:enterochelin esterase family protein
MSILLAACASVTAAQAPVARKAGDYALTPDSLPQPGAPRGRLEGPCEFHSRIFAGTVRRYWLFIPAQYSPDSPASVLVFQDGQRATAPTGSMRVPQVMENLIHKHEMPVTIGIFITPGNLSEKCPDTLGMSNPDNRAAEYDALNGRYARFLIEEMLPEVGKRYRLTQDPEQRAIGGTSSGAICAFTVAWQRPDAFRQVISIIGSYTSIVWGDGAHSDAHGGAILPDILRWLWR